MTNTALAERQENAPAVEPLAAPEVTALTPMQMAYQLVARGSDFASVREMLEYSKGLEREAAEMAFNVAMTAAQAEMGVIATNMTNVQTKSRYADYAQLDRALRPIYSKHGFALSFDEEEIAKDDYVRIVCHVSHSGGHSRRYHRDMPADGKGAKGGDVMTKTHAVGAAASYAMRYILRGIFNVAVGAEDKDGNTVPALITEAQTEELKGLIDKAVAARPDTNRAEWIEAFLEYMHVPALNEISAKDFGKAKAEIEHAIKQAKK